MNSCLTGDLVGDGYRGVMSGKKVAKEGSGKGIVKDREDIINETFKYERKAEVRILRAQLEDIIFKNCEEDVGIINSSRGPHGGTLELMKAEITKRKIVIS